MEQSPPGGWDPAWDQPRKVFMYRPFRGHKRERTREGRADKITKAMEKQPARLSAMKDEVNSRKPVKDINYLFKRAAEFAKIKQK